MSGRSKAAAGPIRIFSRCCAVDMSGDSPNGILRWEDPTPSGRGDGPSSFLKTLRANTAHGGLSGHLGLVLCNLSRPTPAERWAGSGLGCTSRWPCLAPMRADSRIDVTLAGRCIHREPLTTGRITVISRGRAVG